ncbi:MAG TPA: glycosyltransferase family protein [Gemmatimonadaceae bacterium]|nr:glycosyltransferase family protein [Gemmatimonadaceae bacterium]
MSPRADLLPRPSARSPRVVCIVEARFRSTRLPGKVLMPILGEPLLGRMLERLRRARTLDDIVVATVEGEADDAIAACAESVGAGVFRGSEDDVLDRVVRAARACSAEVIVETTGDCPLIDPGIVDKVVGDFLMGGADFVSNILPHTTPRGTDVRVFRTDDLARINETSSDPADHEHVSLHFWEHLDRYRCRNVESGLPDAAATLRLTVDTAEDLELVRAIYAELYPKNPAFDLVDVLELLDRRPELVELNRHIQQKTAR